MRTKLYTIFLSLFLLSGTSFSQSWTALTSGTTEILQSVFFISDARGWVVGNNGTILSTTDGGESWNVQTAGTTNAIYSVFFVDHNNGWISDDVGKIYTTSNGGSTWTEQTDLGYYMRDLHFISATEGWAVGEAGRIYYTADGGDNWTLQHTDPGGNILRAVHFPTAAEGHVVGNSGTVMATLDGGSSWAPQATGLTNHFTDIHFPSASTGYISALGSSGLFVETSNTGITWNFGLNGTFVSYWSVFFTSNDNGWMVGDAGTILSTTDGGSSWTESTPVTSDLFSVYFPSNTIGYAVGNDGTILRTGATSEINESTISPLRVYPNPASNYVQIDFGGSIQKITIRNISGEIVLTTEDKLIDIQELASGSYIIELLDQDDRLIRERWIKN